MQKIFQKMNVVTTVLPSGTSHKLELTFKFNSQFQEFSRRKVGDLKKRNTIRDGGSTALKTADTVDTVDMAYTFEMIYTVDMFYAVDIVYTVDKWAEGAEGVKGCDGDEGTKRTRGLRKLGVDGAEGVKWLRGLTGLIWLLYILPYGKRLYDVMELLNKKTVRTTRAPALLTKQTNCDSY